ncbi:Transmembrane protein [Dirofilaria immitis]|nr:Transmembrane protein [Dirofilaria immitis]
MTDDKNSFRQIFDEWRSLKDEFEGIEDRHRIYLGKLQEISKLQEGCQKAVKHCLYRLSKINESLKSLKGKQQLENAEYLTKMKADMAELDRRAQDMKGELPVQNNGILDLIINFTLVWFYCTLTIRESILRINGSRIKGWWIMHHYVSCVLSGITVTWGDGECYRSFRTQFITFCFYLSFVQLLQCRYQTGCLRRLHALGQRYSMDVSVEGFSSWMFKGLTFLIPFLVSSYIFQFYNSYKLFYLSKASICISQWQIQVLSYGFFIVACCNMFTLLSVIMNKWTQSRQTSALAALRSKYRASSPAKMD